MADQRNPKPGDDSSDESQVGLFTLDDLRGGEPPESAMPKTSKKLQVPNDSVRGPFQLHKLICPEALKAFKLQFRRNPVTGHVDRFTTSSGGLMALGGELSFLLLLCDKTIEFFGKWETVESFKTRLGHAAFNVSFWRSEFGGIESPTIRFCCRNGAEDGHKTVVIVHPETASSSSKTGNEEIEERDAQKRVFFATCNEYAQLKEMTSFIVQIFEALKAFITVAFADTRKPKTKSPNGLFFSESDLANLLFLMRECTGDPSWFTSDYDDESSSSSSSSSSGGIDPMEVFKRALPILMKFFEASLSATKLMALLKKAFAPRAPKNKSNMSMFFTTEDPLVAKERLYPYALILLRAVLDSPTNGVDGVTRTDATFVMSCLDALAGMSADFAPRRKDAESVTLFPFHGAFAFNADKSIEFQEARSVIVRVLSNMCVHWSNFDVCNIQKGDLVDLKATHPKMFKDVPNMRTVLGNSFWVPNANVAGVMGTVSWIATNALDTLVDWFKSVVQKPESLDDGPFIKDEFIEKFLSFVHDLACTISKWTDGFEDVGRLFHDMAPVLCKSVPKTNPLTVRKFISGLTGPNTPTGDNVTRIRRLAGAVGGILSDNMTPFYEGWAVCASSSALAGLNGTDPIAWIIFTVGSIVRLGLSIGETNSPTPLLRCLSGGNTDCLSLRSRLRVLLAKMIEEEFFNSKLLLARLQKFMTDEAKALDPTAPDVPMPDSVDKSDILDRQGFALVYAPGEDGGPTPPECRVGAVPFKWSFEHVILPAMIRAFFGDGFGDASDVITGALFSGKAKPSPFMDLLIRLLMVVYLPCAQSNAGGHLSYLAHTMSAACLHPDSFLPHAGEGEKGQVQTNVLLNADGEHNRLEAVLRFESEGLKRMIHRPERVSYTRALGTAAEVPEGKDDAEGLDDDKSDRDFVPDQPELGERGRPNGEQDAIFGADLEREAKCHLGATEESVKHLVEEVRHADAKISEFERRSKRAHNEFQAEVDAEAERRAKAQKLSDDLEDDDSSVGSSSVGGKSAEIEFAGQAPQDGGGFDVKHSLRAPLPREEEQGPSEEEEQGPGGSEDSDSLSGCDDDPRVPDAMDVVADEEAKMVDAAGSSDEESDVDKEDSVNLSVH